MIRSASSPHIPLHRRGTRAASPCTIRSAIVLLLLIMVAGTFYRTILMSDLAAPRGTSTPASASASAAVAVAVETLRRAQQAARQEVRRTRHAQARGDAAEAGSLAAEPARGRVKAAAGHGLAALALRAAVAMDDTSFEAMVDSAISAFISSNQRAPTGEELRIILSSGSARDLVLASGATIASLTRNNALLRAELDVARSMKDREWMLRLQGLPCDCSWFVRTNNTKSSCPMGDGKARLPPPPQPQVTLCTLPS